MPDIDIDFAPGWTAPAGAVFARSGDQAFALNAAGVLTRYPANTPRPAYDPVTLDYRGVLFEPASTNLCKNPGYAGATPGTLGGGAAFPTDWGSGGIGVAAEATLPTEDGFPIWRVRFHGDAGPGSTYFWIQPIPWAARQPAVAGDVFTISGMVRHWAGTASHYQSGGSGMIRFQLDFFDAGGSNIASLSTNFTPGANTKRMRELLVGFTGTAPANTATVASSIAAGVGPNMVDFTLDFAGLQIEKKAFATSRIYPPFGTTALQTRNADLLTWVNTDAIGSERGSVFAEVWSLSQPPAYAGGGLVVRDPGGGNLVILAVDRNGTGVPLLAKSSSAFSFGGNAGPRTGSPGSAQRVAVTYSSADLKFSANGAVTQVATGAASPTGLTTLSIDGAGQGHGLSVRRVKLFPIALTDAQIEVLTATGVAESSMPIFPSLLLQPSGADFALVGNTQVQTSPLDGTSQTLEMPGARWEFSLSWEFLPEDQMRILAAFLSSLRGRGRKFLWAPTRFYARKGTATGTPLVKGANQTGTFLLTDGWTSNAIAFKAGDWVAFRDAAGRQWLHMLEEDAVAAGGIASLRITPPIRRSPLDNEPIILAASWGRFMLTDDKAPPIQLAPPLNGSVSITIREVVT